MSFYSIPEVRHATHRTLLNQEGSSVEELLRRSCDSAKASDAFDVFLVCNAGDEALLLGVKTLLQERSMKVYADRLSAHLLPTHCLTSDRVMQLKQRMGQARSLLFIVAGKPELSPLAAWMLGFFDGAHQGGVAILPLVDSCGEEPEVGSEIGFYPVIVHSDQLHQPAKRAADAALISLDTFLGMNRTWSGI
ncbi:MAG: hypothetical protein ACI9W6_001128 [Motiliproteus sp.]|jgi:hypothetical protein